MNHEPSSYTPAENEITPLTDHFIGNTIILSHDNSFLFIVLNTIYTTTTYILLFPAVFYVYQIANFAYRKKVPSMKVIISEYQNMNYQTECFYRTMNIFLLQSIFCANAIYKHVTMIYSFCFSQHTSFFAAYDTLVNKFVAGAYTRSTIILNMYFNFLSRRIGNTKRIVFDYLIT